MGNVVILLGCFYVEVSGPEGDLSHLAFYLRLLYGDTYGLPFIHSKSDILFYHKYPTLD